MFGTAESSAFKSLEESSCFTPGRCSQPLRTRPDGNWASVSSDTKAKAPNNDVLKTDSQFQFFYQSFSVNVPHIQSDRNYYYITLLYNIYNNTEVNF